MATGPNSLDHTASRDDGTLTGSEPATTGTATFRLRRQAVAFSHRFDRDVELTGR